MEHNQTFKVTSIVNGEETPLILPECDTLWLYPLPQASVQLRGLALKIMLCPQGTSKEGGELTCLDCPIRISMGWFGL